MTDDYNIVIETYAACVEINRLSRILINFLQHDVNAEKDQTANTRLILIIIKLLFLFVHASKQLRSLQNIKSLSYGFLCIICSMQDLLGFFSAAPFTPCLSCSHPRLCRLDLLCLCLWTPVSFITSCHRHECTLGYIFHVGKQRHGLPLLLHYELFHFK